MYPDTMQDTLLHFLSNNTSNQSSPFPYPKSHNFAASSFHDYFSPLSCPRNLHFPSLSFKTKTISLPLNPLKTPEIPSISSHHTPPPPPNSEFQEKMLYLDSIGLDIFSLINNHRPIILSASLTNIKSIIDLLTSKNFTPREFRRIISMCPEILNSTPSAITPIITFLLREARVSGSDLKHVINRRPRLLVSSVKHCLRPALYFLKNIGLEEVKRHTYLLSCSVETKLIPRIQYFEKIGFSHEDAVSIFRRFPQLFNFSIKNNIEPKLNYFVVEMGRDLKELKEFPQYFSFSLENRIKPRYQCCVEKGLYFPLHTLLKTSEAQFVSRIDVCCNSSVPSRSSPLYSVNCDIDSSTSTE